MDSGRYIPFSETGPEDCPRVRDNRGTVCRGSNVTTVSVGSVTDMSVLFYLFWNVKVAVLKNDLRYNW